MKAAIGVVVELGYAGTAGPGDRFAGQALFLEWRKDDIFDGYMIPQQDLQFVATEPAQPGASLWDNLRRN
jgi:hypothetical protein